MRLWLLHGSASFSGEAGGGSRERAFGNLLKGLLSSLLWSKLKEERESAENLTFSSRGEGSRVW